MSTFLIRYATSQSSSYPIVLTRLGGPRSRPNQHFNVPILNLYFRIIPTSRFMAWLGYILNYNYKLNILLAYAIDVQIYGMPRKYVTLEASG